MPTLLDKIKTALDITRQKGLLYTLQRPSFWQYIHRIPRRRFQFNGKEYPYFIHPYNGTWRNERASEIPIVRPHVERAQADGRSILEVGNVLSHYFPADYDILDKFEQAPGVINADVTEYKPSRPYDLIVAISTLEHVGFDEDCARENAFASDAPRPADSEKVLAALAALRRMLAPSGRLIVTVPQGYNPALDRAIDSGEIAFTRHYCLKRLGHFPRWRSCSWEDLADVSYNHPYPCANGLLIGIIDAPPATTKTRAPIEESE